MNEHSDPKLQQGKWTPELLKAAKSVLVKVLGKV